MVQKRHLNLQEYQSKELMARYGINIQRFEVASSIKEALDSAHYLSKFYCKFCQGIHVYISAT